MNVVLKGITGSKAYGLDTPTSDTDIKGVFVVPINDILGLFWNRSKETKATHNPDIEFHEVGKFIRLAADCNPSILELLYLDDYLELSPIGQMLIDNRDLFLSKHIYKSYGGYAVSQAHDLNKRAHEGKDGFSSDTKNRTPKHARHCFRLMDQGRQLLETGTLTVRVTPDQRKELFAIGEMSVEDIVNKFDKEFETFDTIETSLPDEPDLIKINELLLTIRRMTL